MSKQALGKNTHLLGGRPATVTVLNRGDKSFKQDLQAITEGLQSGRSEQLQQAREQQLAAQLLLTAEAQRLARRDPRDRRAAALLAGAQQALERARVLDEEAELSLIRVPLVRKTEALLHGRISDETGRPVAGLQVSLRLGKESLPGLAPVESDSAGYYALLLSAELAARLDPKSELVLRLAHGQQQLEPAIGALSLGRGEVRPCDLVLSADELKRLGLGLGLGTMQGTGQDTKPKGRGSKA